MLKRKKEISAKRTCTRKQQNKEIFKEKVKNVDGSFVERTHEKHQSITDKQEVVLQRCEERLEKINGTTALTNAYTPLCEQIFLKLQGDNTRNLQTLENQYDNDFCGAYLFTYRSLSQKLELMADDMVLISITKCLYALRLPHLVPQKCQKEDCKLALKSYDSQKNILELFVIYKGKKVNHFKIGARVFVGSLEIPLNLPLMTCLLKDDEKGTAAVKLQVASFQRLLISCEKAQ
jgi:hypothetical protein